MLPRLKFLLVFMALFCSHMSKSNATDILSYAEEWEKRNTEKKSASSDNTQIISEGENKRVHKIKRKAATKPIASGTASTSKQEVKYKATNKKVVEIKKTDSSVVQMLKKDGLAVPLNESHSLSSLLDPNSGPFFQWLRKALKSLKGEPEKESLLSALKDVRDKNTEINARLAEQGRKFEQQHNIMSGLQKKLKELQFPSLPVKASDKEDFAAGMAAGFGLNDLITAYESFGTEFNKSVFLQGLNDAIAGEMRLSEDEYLSLLSDANNRYELARQQSLVKRAGRHRDWSMSLFRDAHKTVDGISYRIIYPGDKKIELDNRIIISLSRYTPEGVLLEDTDIDGRKIEVTLNNYSSPLKNILTALGLHGEASVAMPVNEEGLPDLQGTYFEKWNVRISEAIS